MKSASLCELMECIDRLSAASKGRVEKDDADTSDASKKELTLLVHAQKALISSDSAVEHHSTGNALYNLSRFDEAVLCYKQAIDLDPNFAVAHSSLGAALIAQGKFDEAVLACGRAVELDPNSAVAHTNLGSALTWQGKLDKAVLVYQRAVELDPNLAMAHNNLASTLQKQGKLDDARNHYQTAAQLGNQNAINALEQMNQAAQVVPIPAAKVSRFREWIRRNPKKSIAGGILVWSLIFGIKPTAIAIYKTITVGATKGVYGVLFDTEYKTCEFSTPSGTVVTLEVPAKYEPIVRSGVVAYNQQIADKKANLADLFTTIEVADLADGIKDGKTNESGAKMLCSFLESTPEVQSLETKTQ